MPSTLRYFKGLKVSPKATLFLVELEPLIEFVNVLSYARIFNHHGVFVQSGTRLEFLVALE